MTRWLSTMIAATFLFAHAAQADGVDAVKITEFGIYDRQTVGRSDGNNRGPDWVLQTRTDRIPGRQGIRFGVTYAIVGSPNGAPVKLSVNTKFPPAGILDASARRHQSEESTRTEAIGASGQQIFEFSQPWRIVPGDWTFEFFCNGRKVGEQHFTVVEYGK